jgi:hypothetical protein
VLDWISHRADMPLWPGSPRHGLGLWNSLALTLVVEFTLFAAGVWIYAQYTRPRDRWGQWLLASFVGVLGVVYLASVFGPPPPSVKVLAWSGLLGWLFLAWAYWIDRHRKRVDLDRKRGHRRGKPSRQHSAAGPPQGARPLRGEVAQGGSRAATSGGDMKQGLPLSPSRVTTRATSPGVKHGAPRPDPAHR